MGDSVIRKCAEGKIFAVTFRKFPFLLPSSPAHRAQTDKWRCLGSDQELLRWERRRAQTCILQDCSELCENASAHQETIASVLHSEFLQINWVHLNNALSLITVSFSLFPGSRKLITSSMSSSCHISPLCRCKFAFSHRKAVFIC